MIVQTLLCIPDLPFKIKHAVLAATSIKAAHSDLLDALPNPGDRKVSEMTREEQKELITPLWKKMYDEKWLSDSSNDQLFAYRLEMGIEGKRPAKTVMKQVNAIAGYDVRKTLPAALSPDTKILIIHGTRDVSVYFSERKYLEKLLPKNQLSILSTPDENFGHQW